MAKFVDLTKTNNSTITVNPENVVSVEVKEINTFSKDVTVVTTKDGSKIEVLGSRSTIKNELDKGK